MHEKCKENHPRQRIFRAINKSTQQFTTPKLTHNLFVVERLSWTAVALEKKIAIIFIILYKEKVMLPRHDQFSYFKTRYFSGTFHKSPKIIAEISLQGLPLNTRGDFKKISRGQT